MGKDNKGKELGRGLVQLKDGRYKASYIDNFGKRKGVYGFDLNEVLEKYNAARAFYRGEELAEEKDPTLEKYFEVWIIEKSKTITGTTEAGYRQYFRNLGNYIGKKKLSEITIDDFALMAEDLYDRNYKTSYITCARILLHQIFESALKKGVVDRNPIPGRLKDVLDVPSDELHVVSMTIEEEQCFLDYIYRMKIELREVMAFLLYTGLRCGEMSALTWDNVDMDNNVIHINAGMREFRIEGVSHIEIGNPKTHTSIRDVPLMPEAKAILNYQWKFGERASPLTKRKYGNLVFTRKGEVVKHLDIYQAVQRVLREMDEQNIPMGRVTPHVFRHTFITRCMEAGMDPLAVAAIAGHKKSSFTADRYTTASDEFLKKCMEESFGNTKKNIEN